VVETADPPVAVMPVRDGIEKYASAQANGAEAPMVASLVRVTASGLSGAPLARTVSGVVSAWDLPLTDVAKFQVTVLGVLARHPGSGVVRALVVYPVASDVFAGSCTAVMVTGYGFGLAIVTTTSPVTPG
jgi:hypothetical protein